ncbi:MAG TPA: cyclodeaminase/cyclohydrolase family protein [Jiangellaceae bacterium]|nr:cyclodeaminase/cyclohydrolase family protein [Jiangellaceae bacterium]
MPVEALSVGAFLNAVASREPAPGGGGAAAITTAAAAGLVAMAARFSTDELTMVADRADALRAEVTPLVDEDATAYTAVLEAARLPREQDDRKRRLTEALQVAADVPLRIARVGSEVAELAARLVIEGNPNVRGDAHAGVFLADGATQAAAELVRLNVEYGNLAEDWLHQARACTTRATKARQAANGISP